MIIYTCIILFALIFVAASIGSYYDSFISSTNSESSDTDYYVENNDNVDDSNDVEVDNDYYKLQEEKLKNATLNYVKQYSYDLSEEILIVSMDTLVSFGFMDYVYDQDGDNKCSGYSNVYLVDDDYGVVPYINCSNYVTMGY